MKIPESYNLVLAGSILFEDASELQPIVRRFTRSLKGATVRGAEAKWLSNAEYHELSSGSHKWLRDPLDQQIENIDCFCAKMILDELTDDPMMHWVDSGFDDEFHEVHVSYACRVYRGTICHVANPYETLPSPNQDLNDPFDIFADDDFLDY